MIFLHDNMKKLSYKHTIAAGYIGYITQAIVNNLATLLFVFFHKIFGLPYSQITLLITLNFLIQLCVDLLSAYFVDKIGYRTVTVFSHVCAAAGLVGMAVFPFIMPPLYGLIAAVLLYAVGGGLIEVVVSPIIEACPTENKASSMSLLHSFYCWGTVAVIVFSTIFFAVFGMEKWRILACLWALVPLANAIYFLFVPIYTLTEKGGGMTVRELIKTGVFWLFVILMFASGASELAMSQWASALTETSLGVSKTAGDLLGACMFSVLMGCSRVFYAKMSEKIDLVRFILFSGILCAVSYAVTAFSPSPIVSLIGCALCGLSVGIMWPGVYSVAAAGFKRGGTTMFALLALAGDLGCSSGPTAVGFLSSVFGDDLKRGLAFGVIFPAVLIAGIVVYRRRCEKLKR